MRLLDAWAAMPEPERSARLRQLRAVAWVTLHQREAAPISIASRCTEAGVAEGWAALDEALGNLSTLSLRRLLCELANVEVRK